MPPELSVIIPAFNRTELLRNTLASVDRAIQGIESEIIVIDDGSEIPLEDQLSDLKVPAPFFFRQENQGLVFAKNKGLNLAQGKYVVFLDSDDLVHQDKFHKQIRAMVLENADVSYTDVQTVKLNEFGQIISLSAPETSPLTSSPVELFVKFRPPPHSPLYRRSFLLDHLSSPIIAPHAIYNSIGEVWMYFNLALSPAKIVKVNGALTLVSEHADGRLTNHWERLGIASLALMKSLHDACQQIPESTEVQATIGEAAFHAWRRLPRKFHLAFEQTLLEMWRNSPKLPLNRLGGSIFQRLASYFGPEKAARILKRFQRPVYGRIKTISEDELAFLFQEAMQVVIGESHRDLS